MFRKHRDVYGMNRRNRDLVYRCNSERAIKLANDKIACKKALVAEGIPVPALIAELHGMGGLSGVLHALRKWTGGFVTKPAQGSQGMGVEIFSHTVDGGMVAHQGKTWSDQEFAFYICRILSGEYSKGKPTDSVIIEERILPDGNWMVPELPGAPDLRVIVFEQRPVLAMARIPTECSEGKANLHRGGVGVGICLDTGCTTHAIWKERPVDCHPDTGARLAGRPVEDFGECLRLAALCARAVPLGFMGVDIMRDRNNGPCVIEVNARPGLAIQLANRMGLAAALERKTCCMDVIDKKSEREEDGLSEAAAL